MNFTIFALVLTGLLMLTGCSKNESTSTKRAVSELEYFQALVKTQPVTWTTIKFPASNDVDVVTTTLAKVENSLSLIVELVPHDSVMLDLIEKYRRASLSADQIRATLRNLGGREIDVIGMIHISDGISTAEAHRVATIQCSIADVVDGKYQKMWSEEYSGGKTVTKDNCWEEIRDEMLATDLPERFLWREQKYVSQSQARNAHFWAGYQTLFKTNGTSVLGGDYRPLKSVVQRVIGYGGIYQNLCPKGMDMGVRSMIMRNLGLGRDLYVLTQIASSPANGKEVIVFGVHHAPHMVRVLSNNGVRGTLRIPQPEDTDSDLISELLVNSVLR